MSQELAESNHLPVGSEDEGKVADSVDVRHVAYQLHPPHPVGDVSSQGVEKHPRQ